MKSLGRVFWPGLLSITLARSRCRSRLRSARGRGINSPAARSLNGRRSILCRLPVAGIFLASAALLRPEARQL